MTGKNQKEWKGGSYTEGNLVDALAKATAVKEKAAGIMSTLGMQLPEAAQK